MLVSVLINNYNYSGFLEETINSVINQTYNDIEIVIVDDGSTDNSRDLIDSLSNKYTAIKTCYKENGGQLSAFNAGHAIASGEIICFLDADDIYKSDYVQEIVKVYEEKTNCDFLFCGLEEFDQGKELIIQSFENRLNDLGYTAFVTYYSNCCIGDRTSAISMRRSLADEVFPIPLEEDWRICADTCVLWLASLVGGRKFYLAEPLVKYRIHGNNFFAGRKESLEDEYKRRVRDVKFFGWIAKEYPQYRNIRKDKIFRLLLTEAMTGNKNARNLRRYAKCMSTFKKLFSVKQRLSLYKMRKNPAKFIESQKKG